MILKSKFYVDDIKKKEVHATYLILCVLHKSSVLWLNELTVSENNANLPPNYLVQ